MTEFTPKRILCLIDLSEVSPTVLSWARLFAAHFGSRLELFHAAPWGLAPKVAQPSALQFEMLELELRGQIQSLADAAFARQFAYEIVITEGHPVRRVLDYVAAESPHLIVLGSHGYDGVGKVQLGSVAENLVRLSPCPLVIVKGAGIAANQMKLERIVCPVNLTDFADQCLGIAANVASTLNAELQVIQAVEEMRPGFQDPEWELHEWIPQSVRERCRISESVLRGEASEQIIGFLRQTAGDLVVLGADHRPLFEFTTLGRTTERVVRYSPCSVLLVPRKD
jgi:nucleotide-binding universal stress UspA family protein